MEIYTTLSDNGYEESDKNITFYFLQRTPKGAIGIYIDKLYKRSEFKKFSNSNLDYIRKSARKLGKKYSYAEMSKVVFRAIFSDAGVYSL